MYFEEPVQAFGGFQDVVPLIPPPDSNPYQPPVAGATPSETMVCESASSRVALQNQLSLALNALRTRDVTIRSQQAEINKLRYMYQVVSRQRITPPQPPTTTIL
ncbi:hypothetical protein EBZ80_07175 [bacterium]|nr:hypothetical protein [bacterium]